MKIYALDLSTKTGLAHLELLDDKISLLGYWHILLGEKSDSTYPFNYLDDASKMARMCCEKIDIGSTVVIEETNLAKQRYSQKLLEFIHCSTINMLMMNITTDIYYIDSVQWRRTLDVKLTKQDRENNKIINKAKRDKKVLDKKALGISGKITPKHLAIRYVNQRFNTTFKLKDNDIADAICVGTAFLENSPTCTGDLTKK